MAPYIEPLETDGLSPDYAVPNGHDTPLPTGTSTTAHAVNDQTPSTYEPIAIIGCGMRLPGNVNDADALFDFLDEKGEGRCRVPPDRYNIEAFYASNKNGHVGTEHG